VAQLLDGLDQIVASTSHFRGRGRAVSFFGYSASTFTSVQLAAAKSELTRRGSVVGERADRPA
jgi:hypothetical protein